MLLELLDLTPLQIIFSITVIFLAYTVKGLSGFGSGLIAIPLLAFMFPLAFIVPVLGLLSYSGTLMQSIDLRKQHVRIDQQRFNPVISVLLMVSGVMLIIKSTTLMS